MLINCGRFVSLKIENANTNVRHVKNCIIINQKHKYLSNINDMDKWVSLMISKALVKFNTLLLNTIGCSAKTKYLAGLPLPRIIAYFTCLSNSLDMHVHWTAYAID